MKKTIRFNLCISLLSVFSFRPALSQADTYIVKSVTGHATLHDLGTGKLKRIRSQQNLPVGTLIHVEQESKIELEILDDDLHQVGDIKTLIIRSPGVIRLPRQTRTASTGDYALKTIPKNESPLPALTPMMEFSQAWKRLTAMLIFSEEKSKLPKVAQEVSNLDISTASYLGKIEWHYPVDNLTVYSRKYPTSLDILWNADPQHRDGYKIYFWPMHQSRSTPLELVKNDRFTVTIPTDGSYFLQVTTADGRYRTSRRVIHAAAPSQRGKGQKPELKTEVLSLKSKACDMLPGHQFVLFGDPGKTPVTLSWNFTETNGHSELITYKLQVSDGMKDNYVIDQLVTTTTFNFIPPFSGEFSWQVEAKQGALTLKCSAQTLLFLESAKTDDAIDAFISAINLRQARKILVQAPSNGQANEAP